MTKKLGIISRSAINFYTIKKTVKPIVEINGTRDYRVDDDLFFSRADKPDALLFYRMESVQPLGFGEKLDSDRTKMYIDSMNNAKKKPSKFGDGFTMDKIIPILIVGAVLLSIIYAMTR